jgi:hypothetical protein
MTEPAEQPTVHLFGFREPAVLRFDPNAVARFIMGMPVALDEELAVALRAEFNAQERYRVIVIEAVQKVCSDLLQTACENVAAVEHPVTSTHEAFWRGYQLGKYEALSTAAAALSEVPIVAAMAMEGPDGDAVGQP